VPWHLVFKVDLTISKYEHYKVFKILSITRQLILDGHNLLQLLFVLNNENVGTTIFGDILASLDAVGRINPGRNSSSKDGAQISQKPFWRIESQDSNAVVTFEAKLDECFGDSFGFWNKNNFF
jgi:hypothetical protein